MWEAHFRRQFDNRHPYLRPSSGMIKKLFNLVVEGIKQHLKTLMKKPQLSKEQTMLLVGGFADFAFLQQELKTECARRLRIFISHYTTIAIVQGAVVFGKNLRKYQSMGFSF